MAYDNRFKKWLGPLLCTLLWGNVFWTHVKVEIVRIEMGVHYWKGGGIKGIKSLITLCFMFFGLFSANPNAF